MLFTDLKSQVIDFASKIQNMKADHEKRKTEIRETYVSGKIPIYSKEENERYEKAVRTARLKAINKLNDSVDKLETSEGGITDKIDVEVLNELNVVALSGIGLTATELSNVGEKVLASGSAICCRKLSEIASQSGFDIDMPDPMKARNILYQASGEMLEFFKNYSGVTQYDANSNIGEERYQFMANGNFLNSYEKQFERATSSNLARIKSIYDEAQESGHKETIQEAEQQFKKMVQSTELPEVKPSAAAEYAQKYSAHMNPKVNEAQAKFMQPNTDVKTRRAPRPAERPDISLDMNVSNASQYAKLASEKAFMNAAKLIDNSAELSEDKSPVTI